ncbi:flagellar export chaperone FliS [Burkholderia ubonensis]|uniref:flagellar export chaperone FliS n=1 Tax=Burkholderia ubonensis TaxID=101571 RepID=UPI00075BECA0|nr:flagellar export chaperone FliS [Burkholderia ubonensis]KWB79412.1 flagellar protein FliS [Burkholderia ubonensis]
MNMQTYRTYHAENIEAQVANASPVELVRMLMARLLEEMARARAHIVARRYEAKGRSIIKCIDILTGLSSALDYEKGGEAAIGMARLYQGCILRLNEAGITLAVEPLDEVATFIGELDASWSDAMVANGGA